jgi:hypothetical protein
VMTDKKEDEGKSRGREPVSKRIMKKESSEINSRRSELFAVVTMFCRTYLFITPVGIL